MAKALVKIWHVLGHLLLALCVWNPGRVCLSERNTYDHWCVPWGCPTSKYQDYFIIWKTNMLFFWCPEEELPSVHGWRAIAHCLDLLHIVLMEFMQILCGLNAPLSNLRNPAFSQYFFCPSILQRRKKLWPFINNYTAIWFSCTSGMILAESWLSAWCESLMILFLSFYSWKIGRSSTPYTYM